MNVQEKAKAYAEGKAFEAITTAIEKAYAEGYSQGYADCAAKIPDESMKLDDVMYVDLGLPSGTLWATSYIMHKDKLTYFTYDQASEKSLPTPEQWKELRDHCKCFYQTTAKNYFDRVIFLGVNGKRIEFTSTGRFEFDSIIGFHSDAEFWLKDDVGDHRYTGKINYDNGCWDVTQSSQFKGFMLPVRLVKNP